MLVSYCYLHLNFLICKMKRDVLNTSRCSTEFPLNQFLFTMLFTFSIFYQVYLYAYLISPSRPLVLKEARTNSDLSLFSTYLLMMIKGFRNRLSRDGVLILPPTRCVTLGICLTSAFQFPRTSYWHYIHSYDMVCSIHALQNMQNSK